MPATISMTDTTNGRKVAGFLESVGLEVSIRLVALQMLSGPRDVEITHSASGRYIVSNADGAEIARIDAQPVVTPVMRRQDMATPKQMAYLNRLISNATTELRSRVTEVTEQMRNPMTKAQASLAISRLTWGEEGDY